MDTLLQYIKPWMQWSISKSKVRMKWMMEQKAQAVHQRLDAFELRVLPQRLSQSLPLRHPVDEVVITALFGDDMPPPDSLRSTRKNLHSGRTSNDAQA
uniref:Integrase core domain containing protein n=1 Tax=Solanum tuberosum TaxID=4113 RepID=M1DUA0_SOLTU